MSVSSFIPEIWNANLELAFRENAIAASLVNREYEGDARMGNTVKVSQASAVTIYDYSVGAAAGGSTSATARTTAAHAIASTSVDLLINKEKNFDFYVDDIDRAQAAGSMSVYTQSAGEGLAEDADKFILSGISSAATLVRTGTGSDSSPLAITTGDQAFDVVRDLRKKLNQQKVPVGNRVLVCNAEFEALLLSASSKLTNVNEAGATDALRNANLGRLLGFDVYTSENMPEVNKAACLAWYKPSYAFVSQITETEALRANDRMADRLRGLHVYGGRAVRFTDGSTSSVTGLVRWINS